MGVASWSGPDQECQGTDDLQQIHDEEGGGASILPGLVGDRRRGAQPRGVKGGSALEARQD
jgi:hypothetical protein